FPNKTLDAMMADRPTTLAELGELPGIGPTRLSRFGDDLLEILAKPW
ncbi:MAG: ATP-dependent DNA helicase RecQ, partial [Myxococcota bacterium]